MEFIKRRKLNEEGAVELQPLKVLLICSQPLLDEEFESQTLHLPDLKEERTKISHIFKSSGIDVRLHILAEATLAEVALALQKSWDIVHFTGHGTEENGSLLLEDGFGKALRLKKDVFRKLLADSQVSLLFLSSCFSEQFGREVLNQDNKHKGVSSVVTIKSQFPISQDAAVVFAENLYKSLADGNTVENSFAMAKVAVASHPYLVDEYSTKSGNAPEVYSGNTLITKNVRRYIGITDDYDVDVEEVSKVPSSERFVLLGEKSLRIKACRSGKFVETGIHERKIQGNLIPIKSSFTGRETEIVQIIKAYEKDKNNRICLHGTGGIGKTELAKAVSWWFVERGRLDNVVFASASLAELDGATDLIEFLFLIIKVFCLPIGEGTQLEAVKKGVTHFLSSSRSLIVLDSWENFSNKPAIWNFVLSLPPQVRILITSRNVLQPSDVRNIEVGPLQTLNARKLFWSVVNNTGYFQHRQTLELVEVGILENIGQSLGGMPLAIEVAASQAADKSLREIWDQLCAKPETVLESKDEGTGSSYGVWTTLGCSFGALSEADRHLLTQMTIFQHPITVSEIHDILQPNLSYEELKQSLHRLSMQSLLNIQDDSHYSMYPVVRQFVRSHNTSEVTSLHFSAIHYFIDKNTLESAIHATEHLYVLATTHSNVQAAKLFLLFFAAHFDEWFTQNRWYKTIQVGTRALEIAKLLKCDLWVAYVKIAIGEVNAKIGEVSEAVRLFHTALSIGTNMDDPLVICSSKYFLGTMSWSQGDMKDAMIKIEESMNIAKEHKFLKRIAEATSFMAVLNEASGNYAEAKIQHQESIQLREQLVHFDSQMVDFHSELVHCLVHIDNDKINFLFDHSWDVMWNTGIWRGIIDSMGRLAMIEMQMNNRAKAIEYLDYALKIAHQRKYVMGIYILLQRLGTIKVSFLINALFPESETILKEDGDSTTSEINQQEMDDALKLYKEVLNQVETMGSSWLYVDTSIQLSLLYTKLGDYSSATELLTRTIELAEQLGYKKGVLEAMKCLAEVDFEQQKYVLAIQLYKECLKNRELVPKKEEARLLAKIGKCYQEDKHLFKALKFYEKSVQLYKEMGVMDEDAEMVKKCMEGIRAFTSRHVHLDSSTSVDFQSFFAEKTNL